MSTLLTPIFWFNLRPGSMGSTPRNIFICLIIALIIAAVSLFITKRKKSAYRSLFISLYNFSISNSFLGLLLLFFNYETVPFFSAYFWYLIWVVIMICWLVSILMKLKKILLKKKDQGEVDEIKKYLP
jgi:Ca2+/Na+ antiporter